MELRLLTDEVWTTITRLARSAETAHVAVAYLGSRACDRLPLPPGSTLVVDASDEVVARGMTDPGELERYVADGVEVFTLRSLHAKVFVLGDVAVVGSANCSNHSATSLVEAAVLSDEATFVDRTRTFVALLPAERLTSSDVERLKTIYQPPEDDCAQVDEVEAVPEVASALPAARRIVSGHPRYQEMMDRITAATGMAVAARARIGRNAWTLTDARGPEVTVLMAFASKRPTGYWWWFGIEEGVLSALATLGSGFFCMGIWDEEGSVLQSILCVPAAAIVGWAGSGVLGKPQVRGRRRDLKLNICTVGERYYVGKQHGEPADAYVNAYHLLRP